jgi:hypothetical protein
MCIHGNSLRFYKGLFHGNIPVYYKGNNKEFTPWFYISLMYKLVEKVNSDCKHISAVYFLIKCRIIGPILIANVLKDRTAAIQLLTSN